MFNPARLSLARKRARLSKKQLAEALGVDQRTIQRYEAGQAPPPPETVQKLAAMLAFPEPFFTAGEFDEPSENTASFRGMSHMPARDRHCALAAGALAFVLGDWVEKRFDLNEPDLMDLSGDTPEVAARVLREMWGLGERPIRNMVHLLEGKGVRVFSLVEDTRTVDAFSIWRRDKPYVFLNTFKTPEHSRFDAAHELGHLVLHRHGGPRGREAEDEAHRFAASFLMPEDDVRAEISRVMGLDQILRWKSRWRVSVAALNYRLHKLGFTTEWQYRTFCIQIAERGYRTREPHSIDRETSVVWQKVFGGLREERVSKTDIAEALHITPTEIDKLVFNLATMVSIEGRATGPVVRSRGDHLKLVS